MGRKKPKDKPIKVSLEYESTLDGEERLNKIFEILLSEQKSPVRFVNNKR